MLFIGCLIIMNGRSMKKSASEISIFELHRVVGAVVPTYGGALSVAPV